MQLKVSATVGNTTSDITQLAPVINWGGDIAQCGRTLSLGVLSSPVDGNIPAIDIPLGAGVTLSADDKALFEGFVFSRQKLTEASVMDITCFDRGIYIKRNKASYKFSNMAPETITGRVCADFNIKVGKLETTNVRISRNFLNVSLYQIIQTAYTLAARETGKAYHIRFAGDALNVSAKEVLPETLVIKGGSNLISAAVTESAERAITQVAIYNAEDRLVDTVRNSELIALHGVMQEYVKQTKGEDVSVKAKKMLDDNGVNQKITVHNLGNIGCVTGNAIVVQEPYTGLYGLFWIDSDMHTWKNGLYLNKLVLNFRRMMDEQEAGSLPEAKYSGSGEKEKWEYIYKAGG